MSRKIFKILIISILVPIAYLISAVESRVDDRLHIYFMNVGQGDATLIRTPEDKTIIIDGGPNNDVVRETSSALPFHTRSIDLVILTHPHSDHLQGLIALSSYFEFEKVVENPITADESELTEIWADTIEKKNVPVANFWAGQKFAYQSGLAIEILWPRNQEDLDNSSTNNDSIVLMLTYKEFCTLFMGDAEKEVEEELLEDGKVRSCNVLRVSHHGSASGTTDAFVQTVLPQYSIISVGENGFSHPSEDTIDRLEGKGSSVYRTDEDDTIHLVSDGYRFWVQD